MIQFNGETYASLKEWARAYPAYGRHYAKLVRDGADTTLKLEHAIHAKNEAARKASLAGTLRSPMNTSKQARAAR